MKITIKEGKHRPFHIVFPTRMIFSPMLISLGLRIARKNSPQVPDIPSSAVKAICRSVRETKHRYRCYELVAVESNDGDVVKITL